MADKPSRGLADVVAVSTAVGDIGGRAGLPLHRGYDIDQLAGAGTFVIEQHTDNEYLGERGLAWTPVGRR